VMSPNDIKRLRQMYNCDPDPEEEDPSIVVEPEIPTEEVVPETTVKVVEPAEASTTTEKAVVVSELPEVKPEGRRLGSSRSG
jgi:hypothetical protein